MLGDEIVLKNCYYWASRLVCPIAEFNELVSVGYVVGKRLEDPRLLKDWIHYSMIHFLQNEAKKVAEAHSETIDILAETAFVKTKETIDCTSLYNAIIKSKLSEREYECLNMYFFKSTKQKDIATTINIDQRTVAKYIKRALIKIQRTLEQKEVETC